MLLIGFTGANSRQTDTFMVLNCCTQNFTQIKNDAHRSIFALVMCVSKLMQTTQ